jgi:hypothetical protein
MIKEQIYCNSVEQKLVGNSKLVGCAMKCCQVDKCNLNILLWADIYEIDGTNHFATQNYTCQALCLLFSLLASIYCETIVFDLLTYAKSFTLY